MGGSLTLYLTLPRAPNRKSRKKGTILKSSAPGSMRARVPPLVRVRVRVRVRARVGVRARARVRVRVRGA